MLTINNKNTIEYVSAGLFISDGTWCHPRRCIDSFEIIFMHKGCAYINESGIEYKLCPCDIIFLDKHNEHFGFRRSTEEVSFSWIHFNVDDKTKESLPKFLNVREPYVLKTLFSQCLHVINTPNYDKECAELYTALIINEIRRIANENSSTSNYLAARVKEWLRVNVDKNITVKDVAQKFGYHENHISRVFKQTYNIGIKGYICSQKLEKAKNLLLTTNFTVRQISCELSFQSENHFIKFFKYHTNTTPSEYRNGFTNTHINKK